MSLPFISPEEQHGWPADEIYKAAGIPSEGVVKMIELDGLSLDLKQTVAVAYGDGVLLSPDARSRVEKSRRFIEELIERDEVVYGINTGFGALSEVTIPRDELRQLQVNLVRSHACGVGE